MMYIKGSGIAPDSFLLALFLFSSFPVINRGCVTTPSNSPPYTGGELVLLLEDCVYFSSPSVYRGKPPGKREQTKSLLGICQTKGGSSPFRAQYGEAGRELNLRKKKPLFFIVAQKIFL